MSLRVAGADPGTSSLDLLLLEDGAVRDQCRLSPDQLRSDPALPVRWLDERRPLDLVAGPSGYGLPLRRAAECSDRDLALMALMRPDDAAGGKGLVGLSAVQRALCASPLPVVFLPGVIHLTTVPAHRKLNRIDLGTADKLCVAALAAAQLDLHSGCVVELGSAFTACLVLHEGRIVDSRGGTSGPFGWQSGGAWDGETAYLCGPLTKRELFAGGVASWPDRDAACRRFREDLLTTVAGLQAVTPFRRIILSGRLLETEPAFTAEVAADLGQVGNVERLSGLPGAWVKHAAQGAALLADGLAGGKCAPLVERLAVKEATGSVLDWSCRFLLAKAPAGLLFYS